MAAAKRAKFATENEHETPAAIPRVEKSIPRYKEYKKDQNLQTRGQYFGSVNKNLEAMLVEDAMFLKERVHIFRKCVSGKIGKVI